MITYYPKEHQNKNAFNGGEIKEHQPVVYTPGNSAKPFSNLFYWAHATGEVDSLLGEHPHQAFEILSFVLKCSVTHYDSHNQQWIPLKAGDVQIIRAGKGISHAEKFMAGSSIFQIWFDPNLEVSLRKPATYNDYAAEGFPVTQQNGFTLRTLKGEGSPLQMDSEGVEIKEIGFAAGKHSLALDNSKVHSLYLMEGQVVVEGRAMDTDDFAVAKEQPELVFESPQPGKWFIISTPIKTSYTTYAQMHGL